MDIFFDSEFTGLHQHTSLISFGAIAENGNTFYAEFNDYAEDQLNDWLRDNVIHNLTIDPPLAGEDEYYMASRSDDNHIGNDLYKSYSVVLRGDTLSVERELVHWLDQFDNVEMWSDCLAYDWVLFCQLFGGGAECLPHHVYYIPFDICTLLKMKGIDPDISRTQFTGMLDGKAHNALYDAKVIKACHNKLMEI